MSKGGFLARLLRGCSRIGRRSRPPSSSAPVESGSRLDGIRPVTLDKRGGTKRDPQGRSWHRPTSAPRRTVRRGPVIVTPAVFPEELFVLIIEHASQDQDLRASQAALAALAMVNSRFCQIAAPLLYRIVVLQSVAQTQKLFLARRRRPEPSLQGLLSLDQITELHVSSTPPVSIEAALSLSRSTSRRPLELASLSITMHPSLTPRCNVVDVVNPQLLVIDLGPLLFAPQHAAVNDVLGSIFRTARVAWPRLRKVILLARLSDDGAGGGSIRELAERRGLRPSLVEQHVNLLSNAAAFELLFTLGKRFHPDFVFYVETEWVRRHLQVWYDREMGGGKGSLTISVKGQEDVI